MQLEEIKKKYFTLDIKGITLGTLVRLIGGIILVVLIRSKFQRPSPPPLHPLLIRRINISDAIHTLPHPVLSSGVGECENGILIMTSTLDEMTSPTLSSSASIPLNATSLNFSTLNDLIKQQAFSPTGLIPESDHDARYLLRPDYFEQLFWAYESTSDAIYQDISWQAFLRANETCREEEGVWHGVSDVRNRTGGEKIYGIPALRVARLLRWALLTQRENVGVVRKEREGGERCGGENETECSDLGH